MSAETEQFILRVAIAGTGDVESGMQRIGVSVERVSGAAKKAGAAMGPVASSVKTAGQAAEEAGGKFAGFQIPLLQATSTASYAAMAVGGLAVALYSFSGVKLAAQFQSLEVGFGTILHSAGDAVKMLDKLRSMGENTPFLTKGLIEDARFLLNTGSTGAGVTRQMQAIADVGAATQIGDTGVADVTRRLTEMRMRPHIDVEEVAALAHIIPVRELVNAGTGKNFKSDTQAIQLLGSMRGTRAFDVLINGMEKAFGGAAAANANTVLGVIENLGETLKNIMLPTGRLLLPVVGLLGNNLKTIASALGDFNRLTLGIGGLSLMLIGLYRAKTMLVGSALRAISAITALTGALEGLALGAGTAAGATALNAGAQAAGNLGAGAVMIPNVGARIAAWFSKLSPVVKGLGVGLLIDILGNMAGDQISKKNAPLGVYTKDIATFTGWGAGIGTAIEPGGGTLIGGLLGAIIGGAKGVYDGLAEKNKGALEKTAENTGKMADTLEALRSSMIGGGHRAGYAASTIEAEMSLSRMMAAGGLG